MLFIFGEIGDHTDWLVDEDWLNVVLFNGVGEVCSDWLDTFDGGGDGGDECKRES